LDFFEAVEKRRSVRRFLNEPVPSPVITKAIDAALLAPNSSNLQPWEFYWVKTPAAKAKLVDACLSQPAAATASELIVAVSRVDTWRKHRQHVVTDIEKAGKMPSSVQIYYSKIIPLSYIQDPFGVLALMKWILFNAVGLFRSAPRGPIGRRDLFEIVTKTTALACENLMLAITAQGYASCPMEGFDESRVRRLLKLNRHCHVVMVIGIGQPDSAGIFGERSRVARDMVVHEV
jgi:nitroreductase